ncbi:MAG: hypothetical protein AAF570_16260, partial [Bacteroidota bacterium]
ERERTYQFLVSNLFWMLGVIPVSITTLIIFDLYAKNEGEKVTFEQVWGSMRKNYGRLLMAKLVLYVILAVPTALFYLPGLVFFTFLLCVELLMLQHNYPVGRAISRSWSVMGKNFWPALWTNLATFVVYGLFSILVLLPVTLLEAWQEVSTTVIDPDSIWSIVVLALRAFNVIVSFLLFTIPTVAVGIQYFTIREQTARVGIMERIKQIGTEGEEVDIYLEDEAY